MKRFVHPKTIKGEDDQVEGKVILTFTEFNGVATEIELPYDMFEKFQSECVMTMSAIDMQESHQWREIE
jgi:hypothetical protein